MHTDWEDRKEKIENLSLDLQNPRVPKHIKDNNDLDAIRNYLIEKTDVLKIAESIADTGYVIEPNRVPAQANQEWIRENVFAILAPKTLFQESVEEENAKSKKGKEADDCL